MKNYVVPQEYAGFKLGMRNGLTLAGTDPVTGLISAPGGGMKPQDENLMRTVTREGNEEHGSHLKFLLASSLPLFLYMDIGKRMVITPQQALHSKSVKLHMWVAMVEVTGKEPRERSAREFKAPAFHLPQHFHNSQKLRPSFAYALKHFQGRELWPKPGIPGRLLELNVDYMRRQLQEMHLHPDAIEILVPAAIAA